MRLLDTLKHMLGLHGCTLAIEGLPAQARSLGDLRFHVLLRAGPAGLRVRELRVCLEEERVVYLDPGRGEYEYWGTAVRAVVPLPRVVLGPFACTRLPLHLPLPELEPSEPLRRYRLLVVAEVPGLSPRASAIVEVADPAPPLRYAASEQWY